MKTIKKQQLTREAFNKYGTYADMLNPAGPKMGADPVEFFRDMNQMNLGNSNTVSFSICRSAKRPHVITSMEFMSGTEKTLMPLDGDMVCYLAPATPGDVPPVNEVEAFILPKGTMITMKPGVWHAAPFCLDTDVVNMLVATIERGYKLDNYGCDLAEEDRITIL